MAHNRQSDREIMMYNADLFHTGQPRQMDVFSQEEELEFSDPLESALNNVAREHTKFINECVKFFDEYDWEQKQAQDELKVIVNVILYEQTQLSGKLKTVLDTYFREKQSDDTLVKKYSQDILRTFYLVPSTDIQRYLKKVDVAEDADKAISSDWSNVLGDLFLSFKKEHRKLLEREV